MNDLKLGIIESRFADIIWEHAPMTTRALVDICEKELNWKRTTTYTVLKKLCDRGFFSVADRTVTVCLTKDEYCAMQCQQFVDETFSGSLPAFVAAFTAQKKLSSRELEELKALVDNLSEEKK